MQSIRVFISWNDYRNAITKQDFSQLDEVAFQREVVRKLFELKKFAIIDYNNLKYFYEEDGIFIEGSTGVAILSL